MNTHNHLPKAQLDLPPNLPESIRRLAMEPSRLRAEEREAALEEARSLTQQVLDGRGGRFFTKTEENPDGTTHEVKYKAKEYDTVFVPDVRLVAPFEKLLQDRSQWTDDQQIEAAASAFAGDAVFEGLDNAAVFTMDDGEVVVVRRFEVGDSRLPEAIRNEQAAAQSRGIDPGKSSDYQYFEMRSSKLARDQPLEGRVLHSSALKGMVVIPGLPLQFSPDQLNGGSTSRTKAAVRTIHTLRDSQSGKFTGETRVTSDPNKSIDDLLSETRNSLRTGRRMGGQAVKAIVARR